MSGGGERRVMLCHEVAGEVGEGGVSGGGERRVTVSCRG